MIALFKTGAVVLAMASLGTVAKQKAASTATTAHEKRWEQAEVRASWNIALDKAVARFERDRSRYQVIERMRPGGMPAAVVFAIHGRESTWDFTTHLHEGSSLRARTKYVPKGRPAVGAPPFTFEESAEDALYILKREDRVQWSSLDAALTAIEAYNGTGYLRHHPDVPTPYLWSGTTIYSRGKYVADGKFSPTAIDGQPGCAAIFLRMRDRGIPLPF